MTQLMKTLREEIKQHPMNEEHTSRGEEPLFVADEEARILIIGQAPGLKAQSSGIAWGDASGERLVQWLGITEEEFREPKKFALVPMDFYYPGKGTSGDKPPRKAFADAFHPMLLEIMPKVELIVLVGSYAQHYYLAKTAKKNLTDTCHAYSEYLPLYFPIVHPSPLNFRWLNRNPWFEREVIPVLQSLVRGILDRAEEETN